MEFVKMTVTTGGRCYELLADIEEACKTMLAILLPKKFGKRAAIFLEGRKFELQLSYSAARKCLEYLLSGTKDADLRKLFDTLNEYFQTNLKLQKLASLPNGLVVYRD